MNLHAAAAAVREQFPDGNPDELAREEAKMERFGDFAFKGLGVAVLIGIGAMLYAILTSMVISGSRPVMGVVLILFIIFAAMSLAYVFWNETLKDKKVKLDRDRKRSLVMPAEPAGLGPASTDPIPTSVVDDTTKLLPIEKQRDSTRN